MNILFRHSEITKNAMLMLSSFFLISSSGLVEARQITPPIAHYEMCLKTMKENQDKRAIVAAFEEAMKDPSTFIERLSNVSGGSTHSAEWVTNCQNAVNAARSENWLEARNQLSLALGHQKDLPDWLLMKAVADRKTGALEATILDLDYLCKIRKERKDGYKTAWETQTGFKDEYWYTDKVLRTYLGSDKVQ